LRARQLADQLANNGDLHDLAWKAAVADIPRHLLVPEVYRQRGTGQWEPVDVLSPDGLDLVYSPTSLTTKLVDRDDHKEAISSSTKPDLMLRMLETLDIRDGHKVLEIGTGTGYNAALMSHRLGDHHVFSVDIDQDLVDGARERLARIGFHPTLITVDGAEGLPEHAPFDRIIATCSVPRVPWSWAEQLAAGGQILVDVKPGGAEAGNLALLTRHKDRLEGRFTQRWAAFMTIRHKDVEYHAPSARSETGQATRHTTTPPQPWWHNRVVWLLAQVLGLPRGVNVGMTLDPTTHEPNAALMSAPDGSWAAVTLTATNGNYNVTEAGPTPLWETVEHAHRIWTEQGKPDWPQLGLTVTLDAQRLWINSPEEVSWPLP
jgi:methyltransferase of ATP-grasp peptide maturase system